MLAVERTSELGSDDEGQQMVLPARCAVLFALRLRRWRRLADACAVLSLVAVALSFLLLAPVPQGSPAQGSAGHAERTPTVPQGRLAQASAGHAGRTPTMYCVSAMVLHSYEESIFKSLLSQGQKRRTGLGIFGCDGFDVYSARQVWLGRHHTKGLVRTVRYRQVPVSILPAGNAANAELFVNMWSEVRRRGHSAHFDWTVKVDPDAVFFPDRLRSQLRKHALVAEQKPLFLMNCVGGHGYSASSAVSKRRLRQSEDAETVTANATRAYFNGKPRLYGALEVFSRKAMRVYFREAAHCQGSRIQQLGEDAYMAMCLAKFGVAVPDLDIVADRICNPVHTCRESAAAYHPYKTVQGWWGCWLEALAGPKPDQ